MNQKKLTSLRIAQISIAILCPLSCLIILASLPSDNDDVWYGVGLLYIYFFAIFPIAVSVISFLQLMHSNLKYGKLQNSSVTALRWTIFAIAIVNIIISVCYLSSFMGYGIPVLPIVLIALLIFEAIYSKATAKKIANALPYI